MITSFFSPLRGILTFLSGQNLVQRVYRCGLRTSNPLRCWNINWDIGSKVKLLTLESGKFKIPLLLPFHLYSVLSRREILWRRNACWYCIMHLHRGPSQGHVGSCNSGIAELLGSWLCWLCNTLLMKLPYCLVSFLKKDQVYFKEGNNRSWYISYISISGFKAAPTLSRQLDDRPPQVPSKLSNPMILWFFKHKNDQVEVCCP